MPTISYTSRYFTEEDEKRELNELTDAEKQLILDDKYGRNKRNSTSDSDDDISEEMLEKYHAAIEELPPDQSGMYWRACLEVDDDVDQSLESDPARFLRCENYDPKKAAMRMCEYWNTRHEIFGEEDAFKPVTLDGAMQGVIPFMMQIPNFCYLLPEDDHGRTVLCIDRTDMTFKDYDDFVLVKIVWFVFHKALEKQSAQRNGVVVFTINQSLSWDLPSINYCRLLLKIGHDCMPIKICSRHTCISSFVGTLVTPMVKYITPRHGRLRLQIHNCLNRPKMLDDLESFGLQRKNLPRSIGGKCDDPPPWIVECKRMTKEQKRRKKRRKDHQESSSWWSLS